MGSPPRSTLQRVFVGICLTVLFCGVVGCGGAATHGDFRSIQRHEAKAAAGMGALQRDCDQSPKHADDVCAASKAICEIANDTDDADAEDRCHAARRNCAWARERNTHCAP